MTSVRGANGPLITVGVGISFPRMWRPQCIMAAMHHGNCIEDDYNKA